MRASRSATLDEIASELLDMNADIVALQEVDSGTRRAGFVNQPLVLAKTRDFHHAFAASIQWDGGDYGLTVLSRWPFAEVHRHRIEAHEDAYEPRVVLDVTVCIGGRQLRLLNHHADISARSRELGFATLVQLARLRMGRDLVVLGDFNDVPSSGVLRNLLATGLVDVFSSDRASPRDDRRVDYILLDASLARLTSTARVWETKKSDHDALIAELRW
jgi:endonuclease/exonuclease/phosphatase family metal-dependent hydrolase